MEIAGRKVGRIGLGCMGMTWAYGAAERDETESLATIHRALEELSGPAPRRGGLFGRAG